MHPLEKALKIKFRLKNTSLSNQFLYCRLSFGGVDATDFSTFIKGNDKWNLAKQVFEGYDNECLTNNQKICNIKLNLEQLWREMSMYQDPSVHELRKKFVIKRERITLLKLSQKCLDKIKKRLGEPDYSLGTLKAHTSYHKHIVMFLSSRKRSDIDITDITREFGTEYVDYLKFKKGFTQNFVKKSIDRVKNLLTEAVQDGKLNRNPLLGIKEKRQPPGEIIFLKESELDLLKDNPLLSNNLERVADAFLFQCYTGLTYVDLAKFTPSKHITEIKGRKCIQYHRQKTGIPFTIPIFSYTDHLLKKYDDQIPVLSNQKMNQYLKVIAKTVGINHSLSTHIGRKTAGTYLLNNNVPMIVVSKILGHDSIRTTEKMYAHLFAETIMSHTAHLV